MHIGVNKPRILFIANDTTYTYNLRDLLLRRLVREGYVVILLSERLNYINELEEMGVILIHTDTNRHNKSPFSDIRLLASYFSVIRRLRPDLVICYNIKPCVYGGFACRLSNAVSYIFHRAYSLSDSRFLHIPRIETITGLGTALENGGTLRVLSSFLYKAGLKDAECVFFQNRDNRLFFIRNRILSKGQHTRIVPGSGVNLEKYPYLPFPMEGSTHFLFIARILKEKGIVLYLRMARKVHKYYPNTVFHIIGLLDDLRYKPLLNKYSRYPYIIYHGEQKNMSSLYRMASCIVHPSYYPEGISNVLLEALASGRPVISTDRCGCREMVEDGVNGYIIPVKDQEALDNAVFRFLELSKEEQREMGIEGRRKVEREFDREIVVDKYIEEVRRLIEK